MLLCILAIWLILTPEGFKVAAVAVLRKEGTLKTMMKTILKVWNVITGLLAALGGIVVMIRSNSVQPTVGAHMEFQACVAAVLGGNAMSGGKGSVPGAVLGALTLYTIRSAMSLMGIDTSWVQVVIGCVLIVGMLLNNAADNREKKNSLAALNRAKADRSAQKEGAKA